MKQEKITVVVPVYKVEKHLNKCVESIVNQSYKKLEIILVDDGSPDNCGAMCDDMAKKDSRIKVIHKSNGGLSDARNAGIEAASGEYLMFVDSDDYIDETMCEKLYNSLINNNADLSICNVQFVYEQSAPVTECDNMFDGVLTQDEFWDKVESSFSRSWIIACNKLYKKRIFNKIRYPKGMLNEDEAILHKIIYEVKYIATVNEPLYFYLQREDSITHYNRGVKNLDWIKCYFDRALFFNEYYPYDKRIQYCLSCSLIRLYACLDRLPYNKETKVAYQGIFSIYRNVWKKTKHYKYSLAYRCYFSLNAFSPRLGYTLKRFLKVR